MLSSSARHVSSLTRSLPLYSSLSRSIFSKSKDMAALNRLKEKEKEGFSSVLGELNKIHREELVKREQTIVDRQWKDYFDSKKSQSKVTVMLLLFGVALYVTQDTKAKMQRLEARLATEQETHAEKLDQMKSQQVLYLTNLRTQLSTLIIEKLGNSNLSQQQKHEIEKEVANIIANSNAPEKVATSIEDEIFY